LNISGRGQRFCDGIERREFLKISGMALGGCALPGLVGSDALAAAHASRKAVILVCLPGGPPQLDTWDPKPAAPMEIRGEFQPIATNVPGIQISEHFPRLAARMDKLAIIRSLVGGAEPHQTHICFSGFPMREQLRRKMPCLGANVSKLQGPFDKAVPPFFALQLRGDTDLNNPGELGFLGSQYAPVRPQDEGMKNMVLEGVTLDRLSERKALLTAFDRFRRNTDSSGVMESVDAYTQRAFDVLASRKLVEALDLSREDPGVLERYGANQEHFRKNKLQLLLVEAGVRCVNLNFGGWDYHSNNFISGRKEMPPLDQALAALIDDLYDRGLDKDVSVVVWGEFGRTPHINAKAGRDHWPAVASGLLFGGGMRVGQVIGSTDRIGGEPRSRTELFLSEHREIGWRNASLRKSFPEPVGLSTTFLGMILLAAILRRRVSQS